MANGNSEKNGKVLVNGNAGDDSNLQAMAKELGIGYLSKVPETLNKEDLVIIPEELARKYQIVAFEKKEKLLRVAMVDPQNFEALNVLRFITEKNQWELEIFLVSQRTFEDFIDRYASAEKAIQEAVSSLKEEDLFEINPEKKEEEIEAEVLQDAPITKLVQVIIKHAVEGRASDIHVEPLGDKYRVRFRVDGVLHSSLTFPKEVGRAVVSRIKILADLKIDEKRKPQDGRFHIIEHGKKVDFRISTFPVIEGEKVAMRVLSKEDKTFSLESLGLIGRNQELFLRKIREPYGIILLTGPTGSGKSTTLYAFLKILNEEERNIVTLEDPIEYYIDGINQSQIKPEIGYTFANGLRSILRQDPNVIMVGEVRDSETAELAIHAALTGHLVFSTLHTNDAVGALPRMIDMGVESFLLASSIRAVAAQRLVRRICTKCKVEADIAPAVIEKMRKEIEAIPREEIEKYKIDLSKGIKFYEGKGCGECNKTGFLGRIAIMEAIEIDSAVQELVSALDKQDNESKIRQEAKRQGMITMKQDGILKALLGITSLSEVERITAGSSEIGGDGLN